MTTLTMPRLTHVEIRHLRDLDRQIATRKAVIREFCQMQNQLTRGLEDLEREKNRILHGDRDPLDHGLNTALAVQQMATDGDQAEARLENFSKHLANDEQPVGGLCWQLDQSTSQIEPEDVITVRNLQDRSQPVPDYME